MRKTYLHTNKCLLKSLSIFILFFTITFSAYAQKKIVTGIVKDNNGLELIGAAVVVKNSPGVGTITDLDGKYSLRVNQGEILVFSYLGFQNQERTVGKENVINVTLGEDSKLLEDVIVVGYGQQKKESVVGSITQAKGEELLQAGSVTTVSEALTGLLPGVSTMQAAGQPGSTAATILIRGQSSWDSNKPLYLVDGVERDFNELDPNEISSISVLKDASATAVYGIKAANGVILVTTKNGKKGKAKVNFSANYGLKEPTIDTNYAAEMSTNLEYFNQACLNDHEYQKLASQELIDIWSNPNRNKDVYSYTCFVNSLYGTGSTQQYNINVSGGNDFVKYFTSLGYNYDGDIFDLEKERDYDPRTYQKRYNWRSNLDFDVAKYTKFSIKLSGDVTNWNGNYLTKASSNGVSSGSEALGRLYSTVMSYAPPLLSDGRLGYDPGCSSNINYYGLMQKEGAQKKQKNRIYSDFILKQNITKDLVFSGKFSYNYLRNYSTQIDRKSWGADNDKVMYYKPVMDGIYPTYDNNGNVVFINRLEKDNVFGQTAVIEDESLNTYTSDMYYELTLNYAHSFGNHDVSALALFQRRKYKNGSNFPYLEEGWVGRLTYGYKSKYLFEANGAYNGNENFAPGNRFGFFPSAALGWVVSEENFMKENLSFIDFLKIRYSYGQIGAYQRESEENRFSYLSSYSTESWAFDYGDTKYTGWGNMPDATYYVEGKIATNDNTWETSTKQNLGFELNTVKNKLRFTLDLYNESREDIIMARRTLPFWFGNDAPKVNMGETKNHGFDFDVKWNDNLSKNFSYWMKANISISENRIVFKDDLPGTPEYQKDAGKPIGWNSGLLNDGMFQSWDDVYINPSTQIESNLQPGDLKYIDYNSDGTIDTNDKVAIGDPSYASKTYAFSFGCQWKNWSITAMFNGVFDISKSLSSSYLYPSSCTSGLDFVLLNNEEKDSWTRDNKNAVHPVLHSKGNNWTSQPSSYNIRNSDFLRLRNLELKYRLSKALLERSNFISSMEVYVNGNNLYTWQNLPDAFDPEATKLEVYPICKRFNVGMRMSF